MKQIISYSPQKEPNLPSPRFRLLASGTVRQYISIVALTQFVVPCYKSPGDLYRVLDINLWVEVEIINFPNNYNKSLKIMFFSV